MPAAAEISNSISTIAKGAAKILAVTLNIASAELLAGIFPIKEVSELIVM